MKLRESPFAALIQIDLYIDSDEKVLLARFLQMLLQFSFVHGQSVLMPLLTSVKHIKIFPRDLDSYTMFRVTSSLMPCCLKLKTLMLPM